MAAGEAKAAKGGMIGFLAVTLALAGVGAGGGFFLVRHAMEVARSEAKSESEAAKAEVKADYAGTRKAAGLPPIITNLATPGTWVRLEAAVVYDEAEGKLPPALPAEITEDILAFLRTLTVGHITGPSGFLHLKDDLNERAALRSNGVVKDVLIQMLVIE